MHAGFVAPSCEGAGGILSGTDSPSPRHRAFFFTDKMPNNFVYVGFIKAILPNAKIIDARRHPMDSCFGCFKQHFAKGQTFTYDLFELGEFYLEYLQMMEHWDAVLPGEVLRVQYENVVEDLEPRSPPHFGVLWPAV